MLVFFVAEIYASAYFYRDFFGVLPIKYASGYFFPCRPVWVVKIYPIAYKF